jgi:hypothetical protein
VLVLVLVLVLEAISLSGHLAPNCLDATKLLERLLGSGTLGSAASSLLQLIGKSV